MKEELLQFIWANQLFGHQHLVTDSGEILQIIHAGILNSDQGPDFSNARIQIGDTTWAGNIEIHINASDWFIHKHHLSSKYSNVILHVVFNNDLTEEQKNRLNIPVLDISKQLNEELLNKYEDLMRAKTWIACAGYFSSVPEITKTSWLERMVVERLEGRYHEIIELVNENRNDWQESFYQFLARSFGFKVNSDAFFHLAKQTPLHIAGKHKDNLFQLEALLFGQAGLLNQYHADSYPKQLRKEYFFLKDKYNLKPISHEEWNYSRLRPGNFPAIRLAQFAALLHHSNRLFARVQEVVNLKELYSFFDISASSYWDTHFGFDKESKKTTPRKPGKSSVSVLIINTVIPFLFAYGRERKKPTIESRSIDFLYGLPPESNHILDNWQKLGVFNTSAARSQALLHLYKNYCTGKKCLDCHIGAKVLSAC